MVKPIRTFTTLLLNNASDHWMATSLSKVKVLLSPFFLEQVFHAGANSCMMLQQITPKYHTGVSKNRGGYPQIMNFHRVFHYKYYKLHPFWGPIFGNTHTFASSLIPPNLGVEITDVPFLWACLSRRGQLHWGIGPTHKQKPGGQPMELLTQKSHA